MAPMYNNHKCKVEVFFPSGDSEIFIHLLGPVDECFKKFKISLWLRYNIPLVVCPYKIMWIDADDDLIQVVNKEDLEIFVEKRGAKLYIVHESIWGGWNGSDGNRENCVVTKTLNEETGSQLNGPPEVENKIGKEVFVTPVENGSKAGKDKPVTPIEAGSETGKDKPVTPIEDESKTGKDKPLNPISAESETRKDNTLYPRRNLPQPTRRSYSAYPNPKTWEIQPIETTQPIDIPIRKKLVARRAAWRENAERLAEQEKWWSPPTDKSHNFRIGKVDQKNAQPYEFKGLSREDFERFLSNI